MFTWYAAVTWGMTELAGADQQPIRIVQRGQRGKCVTGNSEDGQLYPGAVREKDV